MPGTARETHSLTVVDKELYLRPPLLSTGRAHLTPTDKLGMQGCSQLQRDRRLVLPACVFEPFRNIRVGAGL